ncbi:MAG: HAMP domain-containing histidine kinase [Clostridiaceae bacterium]|nr:HAMP domain-containing histidine kinase [Clostridiaceae bacterium]
MIKTMFGKILIIVILVLVISFTITGLVMNAGITRLITEQKSQQLDVISDRVINALKVLVRNGSGHDSYLFTSYLQTLAVNTDTIIWIIRDDGAIIFYSSIPEYIEDDLDISEEGWPKLPDARQYGATLEEYTTGDFYGLFKESGVEWITKSQRFTIMQTFPYNAEAKGLVLIHSQIPGIYRIKSSILVIFLSSGLIGGAIAFLFVALLSRRIVRPLNQMKVAARKVAAGEFGQRIPVVGKDEIADLSQSFNNMVVALENLEQMRNDFIGSVSHELRTPITTIKGFIQGILDDVIPPEKQKEYLTIARDEVQRMQNLVNDLLDLAKTQGGEKMLKMSDFDINELIRRCVITLQQMLIEKNLEFKADFEVERMFVHADREAIQRVILNLLHNAIKFTPENGEITIRTYKEKDKTYISVEDTGKGIPQDEIKYIFERFYKTDKSRSEDRTGVGLGLAIVRNIIVAHNEAIKVESQEGRGSKFIFTLRSASVAEPY